MGESLASQVLGVIPVRLGSTRLGRKPLQKIGNKLLVECVWAQASLAKSISKLIVATDSEEIQAVCKDFGADVIMTDKSLGTGTERVFQAADKLGVQERFPLDKWAAIANIQGDMPFINPQIIDATVRHLLENNSFDMATVATVLASEEELRSNSVVKVVIGADSRALYFSRAPIPHSRDGASWVIPGAGYSGIGALKHIGLYVFRPNCLRFFERSEPSALERVEMLEQLRALEQGYKIGVCIVSQELTDNSVEVDTPDDLERANQIAARMRS